jgi:putative FmdB family regulatory protein
MRMHEYECHSCGLRFELVRADPGEPMLRCPKCGGASSLVDEGDPPMLGTDRPGRGRAAHRVTPGSPLASGGTEGLGMPESWTVTPWGARE